MKFSHKISESRWITLGGIKHNLNEWFSQQRQAGTARPFTVHVTAYYDGINLAKIPDSEANQNVSDHNYVCVCMYKQSYFILTIV